MSNFALIAEGITDQTFIQAVLEGLYGEDIDVNPLQPALDRTDAARQETYGGWENVLRYLSMPDLVESIFFANEYVVIQIDTDCGEHRNFGVPYRRDGHELTVEELRLAVRNRLIEAIGIEAFDSRKHQIHFAIAVHSLECWLLPLYGSRRSDANRITGCEKRLATLAAANGMTFQKTARHYRRLSSPMLERRNIEHCRERSESFKAFVDSLPKTLNQLRPPTPP